MILAYPSSSTPREVILMEQSELDRRIEERMKQSRIEKNTSLPKMSFRFLRMFLYRAIKGRWHLPAVSEINVDELHDRMQTDRLPVLIDVNFAGEFNQGYGHVPNARSIPIGELEASLEDLRPFKDEEVVTICPGGGMSLVAAEMLAEAGFKDVRSLKGGSDQWFKKGYPTTRS